MTRLEIVGEITAPGPAPAGLAWDGEGLWNADFGAGRIYRLEPETGRVVDSLLCPGVVSGLTWDGTSLWVGIMDEGWLRCVNPATHDFDRNVEVKKAGRLAGLAWDGEAVWAVSQQHGRLLAVALETGEVTRTLAVPVAGSGLAYRDGHLWLAAPVDMRFNPETFDFEWAGEEGAHALLKIEVAGGRTVERLDVDFLPMGLAWVESELWLARTRPPRLVRAKLI